MIVCDRKEKEYYEEEKIKTVVQDDKKGGCDRRGNASGDQESPFPIDRNIIFKGK